ncbi:GAF and ANTAR domain-containing protein [Williamsia sp. DF01-3]|uniref:GAF and ANTAR domain-containing protein n=1 Tax=Williamsia sp. DF01-3 TaxID=2934157 RepID=UPI001FF6E02D|nr:GAF and ANTAR domain-containing protein [Williamsia sp. DF01-3]MCK0516282.1 GAF and ANTAR domain-containing protein [Williamsia sp. DF01-3]
MTEDIPDAATAHGDPRPELGMDPDELFGDDVDDLRNSLSSLSQLAMTSLTLPQTLTHIAEFAVNAIPGADGAGLTLLDGDRRNTVVASDDFVVAVDSIQYSLGEGPCITAAERAQTVRSGSLGGDAQWPRFGPRVGRLGVHSVLSLPLKTEGGVLGAMNVYARAKNAFDDRAVALGELFAVPAAVSVQNAQALANALTLSEQLQKALTNRKVIDHAIGIVVSRSGCTSAEAFAKLREMSQKDHRKLADVAQSIFDDAKRRAQARRSGS